MIRQQHTVIACLHGSSARLSLHISGHDNASAQRLAKQNQVSCLSTRLAPLRPRRYLTASDDTKMTLGSLATVPARQRGLRPR